MIAASNTLALALALEIALLAALARFGWSLAGPGAARWLLAIAIAGAAAVLWGRFAAPKSASRLTGPSLAVFKLAIFGAGALALAAGGFPVLAVAFAVLSVLHVAVANWLGVP